MPLSAVTAVHHDDGIVFLDAESGMLFASNRVGADIWAALHRERTPLEIAEEISSLYDIPHSKACAHVDAFVTALANHKLIGGECRC